MKDGVFTSEFWLTIAVMLIMTALFLTGKITSIEEALTFSTSLLPVVLGYQVSRGLAKVKK